MKRLLIIALIMTTSLTGFRASAQEVVIDPSMIASAAANSAEQIDYMIDQISQLNVLGDKLSGIKTYIDDIFPEEGNKVISLLGELGTLEDLSSAYARSIKMTSESLSRIQNLRKTGLSDVNTLLQMIRQNKEMTEELITRSKSILHQAGFTKMEKKQQIEKICQQINDNTAEIEDFLKIEERITANVQGIDSFLDTVDDFTTGKSTKATAPFSLGGFTKILSTILMLIGIFSLMWGYRIYLQGDSTVFIRIACGILCGVILLGVLSKLFSI